MAKKSLQEKQYETRIKEQYLARVQDLLDLIPNSSVFKYDDPFNDGERIHHSYKWIVGGYEIDPAFHLVFSIEGDDSREPLFYLRNKEYKDVMDACRKRHAELLAQRRKKKSK